MKGKFDAYVLWPLAKRVQNWIVDRSTARNFMVNKVYQIGCLEMEWEEILIDEINFLGSICSNISVDFFEKKS